MLTFTKYRLMLSLEPESLCDSQVTLLKFCAIFI